jgi:hypothetical protein
MIRRVIIEMPKGADGMRVLRILVCGRFGCDVYMLDSQSHDRDPANNAAES